MCANASRTQPTEEPMSSRRRFINVIQRVRQARPDIADPAAEIERGSLLVAGRIITNPRALVPADAPVAHKPHTSLRGEAKLEAALDRFGIEVEGRTCLDVGASAGGFTRVLLRGGAACVFALDAGYGQLRADLRADPRVVNLERTNLGHVGAVISAGICIDVVTLDVSYLSVAAAVPQLEAVRLAPDADLVALVKPMYELHLGAPPTDETELVRALTHAVRGVEHARRWRVIGTMPSPVPVSKGAREWLLHAKRGPFGTL
jgi:23S rRNA (cytidine1920-2'-O)/16S rRNA (cytidine1409-2'-O)-methyltransferase